MLRKLSLLILINLISAISAFSQDLKSTISSIGCKQISSFEPTLMSQNKTEHQQWLKDNFGVVRKSGYLAKCSVNGTFYKFLFEEEVFENESKALFRLKNLRTLPEKEHDKSDYAVPKILGGGFVRDKKLYTVGAFAVFVESEGFVKKYRDKLARKIR
jgi:hypothetical protein